MIPGFRFIGYKSYTEEYTYIDEFSNITVFIGRNLCNGCRKLILQQKVLYDIYKQPV